MVLLISLANVAIRVYIILIIVRAVLSWTNVPKTNRFHAVIEDVTEPVLAPVRSITGVHGGVDISPVIAILLLILVQRMLSRLAAGTF